MAHELSRLSRSILKEPQLITAEKFQEIAEVLESRNESLYREAREAQKAQMAVEGKHSGGLVGETVGVLRVEGPTTYRKTGWEALCGGCSYQSLLEQMDELTELSDVEDILMLVDSPGGEAYRAFETSRDLRKKADAAGKRLIAYVDGMAASAGYALASAAHEIVINPDAEAGSIGVVVRLVNSSKAMDEAGYKVTYITAGKEKVPYDEEGGFKESFLEEVQERVDELYGNFVSHVSDMRGIDENTVRDTEAKMFSANKALELGLVDSVMESEEFYNYLAGVTVEDNEEANDDGKSYKGEQLMTEPVKQPEASVTPEMIAQMQATMEKQAAQLAAYQAKEEAAETEKLTSQLSGMGFKAETAAQLVSGIFMNADLSVDTKNLVNSGFAELNAINEKVTADAASEKLAAEDKIATLEAEKETIKAEFATEQHGVESDPKENAELSGSDLIAQKAAQMKANRK